MITWLFDRRNQWGYVPNLIKDETIRPGTKEWYDLSIQSPFSYEFRFLKYCKLDAVKYQTALVEDTTWSAPAYYPIAIELWDPHIDYFKLMDDLSLNLLQSGDIKVLFYYTEGDDPNVEIWDSLSEMCARNNVSMENVKFVIANWAVQDIHPFVYFPDDELYYRYLHLIDNENRWVDKVNFNRRKNITTCLMRADKLWRKIFASQMYELGLTKESYFSYINYKYETSSIEEDKLENWEAISEDLVKSITRFNLQLPFRADTLTDTEHNNHKLIQREYYNQSYWNIVVETHFNQDTVFLTEKTFKPILNLQPFVVVGNPHSLRLLKQLGYQTFGNIIDETYDTIADPEVRMNEMLNVAYSLHQRSHQDHINMQRILEEVLIYNQEHFLQPKQARIHNLLNQLEY